MNRPCVWCPRSVRVTISVNHLSYVAFHSSGTHSPLTIKSQESRIRLTCRMNELTAALPVDDKGRPDLSFILMKPGNIRFRS